MLYFSEDFVVVTETQLETSLSAAEGLTEVALTNACTRKWIEMPMSHKIYSKIYTAGNTTQYTPPPPPPAPGA